MDLTRQVIFNVVNELRLSFSFIILFSRNKELLFIMKKNIFLFLIITIISVPSADVIIQRNSNFRYHAMSFLHNTVRIVTGTLAMVVPNFALIMTENPAPLYVFPLAAATGVYAMGHFLEYDGKFWPTALGAYTVGLPLAIAMHYIDEKYATDELKNEDAIINAFVIATLSLPIWANFGFNISTKNKEEVLKLSFFSYSNHLSFTGVRNRNIRELNSGIQVRLNILTINL